MNKGRALARFPERGIFAFIVLLWLGFFVLVVAITGGIAIFGEVRGSVWERLTQLPRWFALGIGVWLTGVHLHVYIAHGVTRREFMRRAGVFVVLFAGLAATLTTAGFLLEAALYRMAGWPQTFSANSLYDSVGQVGTILLTYLLIFLGWTVAGTLVAAAYRRLSRWAQLVAFLAAMMLVGATETVTGLRLVPLLPFADVESTGSMPVTLAVGVGAFAAGLTATWALVQEVRVRPEAT